ncbi:MAG: NAD(P)/FAD-dependent oxidoreductase [Clostridia bacterium]|nr:NAD(P)/FAD-dependent oxidoreductase [Clostridia bacterium]
MIENLSNQRKSNRIICLGAGLGGLTAAINLAKKGFEVVIFEKKEREKLGYPWYDSVRGETFQNLGFSVPENVYTNKQLLTFIGPLREGKIEQLKSSEKGFEVDRKALINFLIKEALDSGVEIFFGVEIKELLIKNDKVIGVKNNGKNILSKLVIDSTGVNSPYRKQIPSKFGIKASISNHDIMICNRYIVKKNSCDEIPPQVWIKPDGAFGVSWCKDSINPQYADIFVGELKSVKNKKLNNEVDRIKLENPALPKTEWEAVCAEIPVGPFLSRIVADGYALVGASASMARPVSGSGIEVSLKAGVVLAEEVTKNMDKELDVNILWKYQVKMMRMFGTTFLLHYVFRTYFQDLSVEEIDWIFSSGILNSYEEKQESVVKNRIDKLKNNFSKAKLTLNTMRGYPESSEYLKSGIKDLLLGARISIQIPFKYDKEKVEIWQNEYDSFMESLRQRKDED